MSSRRIDGDGRGASPSVVRHEEELQLGSRRAEDARVGIRTTVETRRVDESVPRTIQHAEIEHAPPMHEDSGRIETLEDGSLSIPVLEEQIVVTRQTVVRERIIVRRREEQETVPIHAELRREHVEIEGDTDATVIIQGRKRRGAHGRGHTAPLPGSTNARVH